MSRNYPIIIGPGFKKGVVAGKSKLLKGGADLFIVRLHEKKESGDAIDKDDIESVEAMIHFCDKSSVKLTIDVLTAMLLKWE